MSTNTKQSDITLAIKQIIEDLMESVLDNVLVKHPFNPENHHANKPMYAALVPDEIFKGSHFERRFVTPFGRVWQKLAIAVGQAYHGNCKQEYIIRGVIKKGRQDRIYSILNSLDHKKKGVKPNWNEEIKYIMKGRGKLIPVEVNCDIFIESERTGETFAFEVKAPLPDKDQTKVSKEKIFKLLAMENSPINHAYFGLPYNPFGLKQDYHWPFAETWFNMQNDPCVLIGKELWELIGGVGAYEKFINEINKLGMDYKKIIYEQYLGIDVPNNINSTYTLK